MEGTGRMTEADYWEAMKLNLRPAKAFAVVGIMLIIAAICVAIAFPGWATILPITYLAFWYFVWMPLSAKNVFRKYSALNETQKVNVNEAGLHIAAETWSNSLAWSSVRKWRHNEKVAIFYPASNIYHIIPASFFPGVHYNEFIGTAEKALGRDA